VLVRSGDDVICISKQSQKQGNRKTYHLPMEYAQRCPAHVTLLSKAHRSYSMSYQWMERIICKHSGSQPSSNEFAFGSHELCMDLEVPEKWITGRS